MAISWKITNETEQVSGASTEFTTTNRGFWLYGKGFSSGEYGRVLDTGHGEVLTNNAGPIEVSANPNLVFVDAPDGTYQLVKSKTALPASMGIIEVQ